MLGLDVTLPMSVHVPVAAGLGAGIGLGLWLAVTGLARRPSPEPSPTVSGRHPPSTADGQALFLRVAGVLGAAAVVGVVTRWPVAAITAGIAAWVAPTVWSGPGSPGARRNRAAELEALATWTESLAATLAAAAGLEQAVIASTRHPPDALGVQLRSLGDAVAAGARLADALRAFARDVDNPNVDAVVAALLLAATHGGANLRDPLTQLAASTRQEVAAQQAVDAGRAQIATDTRLIAGISLAAICGLVVFNRGFLTPYDTAEGQVVLALVIGMACGAFVWLRRLAATEDPPRIVALDVEGDAAPGVGVLR